MDLLHRARVSSSPAVYHGLVYFSYDGNFYAVYTGAGKLRWKSRNAGERRYAATLLQRSLPKSETMPDPFDVYLSLAAISRAPSTSAAEMVYSLDAATGALKLKFKSGDVVHASRMASWGS